MRASLSYVWKYCGKNVQDFNINRMKNFPNYISVRFSIRSELLYEHERAGCYKKEGYHENS